MTCRTAFKPVQQAPSARQRLEKIDKLSDDLLDAIKHGADEDELSVRALEIQGVACIGAAYERRRERGE